MHWIADPAAGQRPVVIVEDKPRHVSSLLAELGRYTDELKGLITIACLAEGMATQPAPWVNGWRTILIYTCEPCQGGPLRTSRGVSASATEY